MLYRGCFRRSDLVFFLTLSVAAVSVLLWQFLNEFGGGEGIMLDPLGVWSRQSPNIPVSILLALAFPLAHFRLAPDTSRNDFLVLSWLMTFAGILLFALFAERGSHYSHGNFGWSYQIALSLLYLFSIVDFVGKFRRIVRWKRIFLGTLLALQIFFGLYYLWKVLQGQNPIYIGFFI